MNRNELTELTSKISRDVLDKNKDQIAERIRNALHAKSKDDRISPNDALVAAIGISLTLVPEISAAITARMLIELGLVEVEDTE